MVGVDPYRLAQPIHLLDLLIPLLHALLHLLLVTGRGVLFSGTRQLLIGLGAAGLTYGVGHLIGVNLGVSRERSRGLGSRVSFIVCSSSRRSFRGRTTHHTSEEAMSPVHLHLLLNHLPVIGTIVAILLLAYALLRRSPELTRVSLGMFVLLALAGAVVYLSGEPAEELVENLPGISESILERHEEAALVATSLLGAVGAIALGGLLAFRKRTAGIPRGFAVVMLLLALAPAGGMGYTANLGGQIRHSEIRPGATAGGEQLTGSKGSLERHERD